VQELPDWRLKQVSQPPRLTALPAVAGLKTSASPRSAAWFSHSNEWSNELFDCVEDDEEMLVVFGVFLFEGVDFLGEQGVGVHQAAVLGRPFRAQ